MFIRMRTLLLGLIIGMTLASCGGGGVQVSEGGIGGSGISTGSITAFGSIWVNGVEFSTSGAKIIEEDDVAGAITLNTDDSDDTTELAPYLSEGMVVTVTGTINDDGVTGTAETISYEDILEGPVVSIISASSLNILGQTVNVTGITYYGCDDSYVACTFNDFTDISTNQVVEVSGLINENGEIVAGYIELQENPYSATDIYEIKGMTTPIDFDNFMIDNLKVTHAYNTGTFDNQFVEAKGTFDIGTSTLTASEIEIENESFDIEDAEKAELEGYVASTNCVGGAPCTFTMGGTTVQVKTTTQYSGSGGPYSASDIIVGIKVEAEGSLQGGILFVDEIEFK